MTAENVIRIEVPSKVAGYCDIEVIGYPGQDAFLALNGEYGGREYVRLSDESQIDALISALQNVKGTFK